METTDRDVSDADFGSLRSPHLYAPPFIKVNNMDSFADRIGHTFQNHVILRPLMHFIIQQRFTCPIRFKDGGVERRFTNFTFEAFPDVGVADGRFLKMLFTFQPFFQARDADVFKGTSTFARSD